jgi:hypothetical protein
LRIINPRVNILILHIADVINRYWAIFLPYICSGKSGFSGKVTPLPQREKILVAGEDLIPGELSRAMERVARHGLAYMLTLFSLATVEKTMQPAGETAVWSATSGLFSRA